MKTFSKAPRPQGEQRRVRCAVCGADDGLLHWDCGSFRFVRCRCCGHVYQNPQPAAGDLLERYDEEYFRYEIDNARNFLDLMLKGLGDVAFFERMDRAGLPKSFLDVGCATGVLLEYARSRGYEVHGLEPCEPAARYGVRVRGVPITVGTLDDGDGSGEIRYGGHRFGGHRYGAVHTSHVIEHVNDPRAFLRRIRSLLVPGGLLVLVTPNTAGLQARLYGKEWRSAIADHLHLFSRVNLERVVREEGLEPVTVRTWGGFGVGTAPPWLKRPADRLAKRLGFGDVMILLARSRG